MDTNDNTNVNAREEVIELGVASIETKGLSGPMEGAGEGLPFAPGISEE